LGVGPFVFDILYFEGTVWGNAGMLAVITFLVKTRTIPAELDLGHFL
jgi:hypothetical protein